MKKLFLGFWLFLSGISAFGQYHYRATILENETGDAVAGANVAILGTKLGAVSNEAGLVDIRFDLFPSDGLVVRISCIGYESYEDTVREPFDHVRSIRLIAEAHEGEEITVTSTRTSRTIDDEPTRVEAITGEELDEKATMRSGDIRMQLNESTGIQVQQTSAVSANASFRIQGLEGRYTQLLKDGFPLYSGFSGGLSITQIPPLDLRQIEIIKGSASTLYGGGAIGGLVNLISKTPTGQPETSAMIDITSARGMDVNAFHSSREGRKGWTVFVSGHRQTPYDANDDGFSDIPKTERWTLNPKIFFYPSDKTTLMFGVNGSLEDRDGGDMKVLNGNGDAQHVYFEKNHSRRFSTQTLLETATGSGVRWNLKNSMGYFDREILLPQYRFDASQWSSFSEASMAFDAVGSEWIAGLNLWTDDFNDRTDHVRSRDDANVIAGAFVQNHADLSKKTSLETGLRIDRDRDYGTFVLPRASLLYRWNTAWSSRIGMGFGYKPPSLFNETAESKAFRNVRKLSEDLKPETSIGANADVNYKGIWAGEFPVAFNQMFYYTRLDRALVYSADSLASEVYVLENSTGHVDSRGFETNARIAYRDLKFFLGYTFIDIRFHHGTKNDPVPLSAKHRLGLVLVYEKEADWRAGLEAYYTGHQHRSDQSRTRAYWVLGFMAQKYWRGFSLYLNFENFLDSRQSRFESMYTGTRQDPEFREIYAPTDGFIMNGGIRFQF